MKDHYPFEFIENGTSPTYFFITSDEVIYEVRFKHSPYIFKHFDDVSSNLYEFVLAPTEGSSNDKKADSMIGITVAEIFKHFFLSKEKVVIYTCDNSDGREAARSRKFDQWFEYFGNVSFLKLNLLLIDEISTERTYLSMILRNDNPLRMQAFEALNSLQDPNNK